ncbi:MAG: hypothetical protein LBB21_02245 [Holosporaceae bacterium]|nr:hypothetical protein [Holosporaceae bacterium]
MVSVKIRRFFMDVISFHDITYLADIFAAIFITKIRLKHCFHYISKKVVNFSEKLL